MIVDCAVYERGRRLPGQIALEDTYETSRQRGAFAWIGLHEPSEAEFDSVRREFDLHELAVEDAIKAHQRPKLEVYDDSLFVVLRTAELTKREALHFGEILLFVGDGFIVTVRHGDAELHDVRLKMEKRPDLLAYGPTAALYAIVDPGRLQGRPRPSAEGGLGDPGVPRAAHPRPDREHDARERAPERGRTQDLGVGGDHRGPDDDRGHLRDELRAHA